MRGSDVFLVQSTSRPVNDNLMELLVMTDAMRRASAGRITAVIPYFGYARQDRKTKARDPISAKLVANMIVAAGADRVLTMDLHAAQIQGFFDIPMDNLYGNPVFVDYYAKKFGERCEDMVVVSPDVGSVSRARTFAGRARHPPQASMHATIIAVLFFPIDTSSACLVMENEFPPIMIAIITHQCIIFATNRAAPLHYNRTHSRLQSPFPIPKAFTPFRKSVMIKVSQKQ